MHEGVPRKPGRGAPERGAAKIAAENVPGGPGIIMIIEWVKTALIILLAAGAVLLGGQTGLFNGFLVSIPLFGSVAELVRGNAGINQTGSIQLKEAARPLTIVVTDEQGSHYGVRFETEERNAVYDRTSSIMGEALGSVSSWLEVKEDEWRAALSGHGVCYEYILPVKMSNLNGWFDARLPDIMEDAWLRRICIAFGEDKSRIYYQDHTTGSFYGADTASSAGKAQSLGIYSPNGAAYAFEAGVRGSHNVPYMLIMPGNEHPVVRSGSAGNAEDLMDAVLFLLGHNNEQYTWSSESDGSLRRVGTRFNIQINDAGGVRYRRLEVSMPDPGAPPQGEGEIIEQARRIVEETLGKVCGAAEVFYEAAEESEGDTITVLFGYYIAGGSVYLPEDRFAARISIASGVVTDLDINFRSFSLTGEYTMLLPERQTLAAAGCEFLLYYSDSGAEILQPAWVLAK